MLLKKNKNPYHVIQKEGIYRSGSEKKTGELLESIRVPFSFEPHYIEYTWLEYKKYLPDFLLPNGIYLEVKGRFKLEDRKKHLFVREHHPDLDIRFVFDYPNSDHRVIEEWANEEPRVREGRGGGKISSKRGASSGQAVTKSRKGSVSKRNTASTPRRNKTRNK
jgi:hypothetical protein